MGRITGRGLTNNIGNKVVFGSFHGTLGYDPERKLFYLVDLVIPVNDHRRNRSDPLVVNLCHIGARHYLDKTDQFIVIKDRRSSNGTCYELDLG